MKFKASFFILFYKAMEKETLHIDFRIDEISYKKTYLTHLKKGSGNFLLFCATGIVFSLLGYFLTAEKWFLWLLVFCVLFPFCVLWVNYNSYIKSAKQAFSEVTDKNIHLTFQKESDGFDCINGKNHSFVSWDSVNKIEEFEDYFSFQMAGREFTIPKVAFFNQTEIAVFRQIIQSNASNNVKLLKSD